MPWRPVVVSGYKPQIGKTAWIITAVQYSLSNSGYTSQITLETLQAWGEDWDDEAGED